MAASLDMALKYRDSFQKNPDLHRLSIGTTCLFREPESCKAVAALLRDKKPTAISIMGSSDGSEVYSYAIAINRANIPFKTPKRITITAVEPEPNLSALNESSYIVCTDLEREIQKRVNTPLNGVWNKFFTKLRKPSQALNKLLDDHADLMGITQDPVAGVHVGNHMDWYKVNRRNMPLISTQNITMEAYVKQIPSDHERQIFVLANSWNYLLAKDTRNTLNLRYDFSRNKILQFMSVIQDIKRQNQDKDVWIVLGNMEKRLFLKAPFLRSYLYQMGVRPLKAKELKAAGISTLSEKELTALEGKIWRISSFDPFSTRISRRHTI